MLKQRTSIYKIPMPPIPGYERLPQPEKTSFDARLRLCAKDLLFGNFFNARFRMLKLLQGYSNADINKAYFDPPDLQPTTEAYHIDRIKSRIRPFLEPIDGLPLNKEEADRQKLHDTIKVPEDSFKGHWNNNPKIPQVIRFLPDEPVPLKLVVPEKPGKKQKSPKKTPDTKPIPLQQLFKGVVLEVLSAELIAGDFLVLSIPTETFPDLIVLYQEHPDEKPQNALASAAIDLIISGKSDFDNLTIRQGQVKQAEYYQIKAHNKAQTIQEEIQLLMKGLNEIYKYKRK